MEARVVRQLRNEEDEKIDLVKTQAKVKDGSLVMQTSYELRFWKLDKVSGLVDLHVVPLWPHELISIAEVALKDDLVQQQLQKEGEDDDDQSAAPGDSEEK